MHPPIRQVKLVLALQLQDLTPVVTALFVPCWFVGWFSGGEGSLPPPPARL